MSRVIRPGFLVTHEKYDEKRWSNGCNCIDGGGKVTHCNEDHVIAHKNKPYNPSRLVSSTQTHCAFFWERPGLKTRTIPINRVTFRIIQFPLPTTILPTPQCHRGVRQAWPVSYQRSRMWFLIPPFVLFPVIQVFTALGMTRLSLTDTPMVGHIRVHWEFNKKSSFSYWTHKKKKTNSNRARYHWIRISKNIRIES
jgi:hypothetical protein